MKRLTSSHSSVVARAVPFKPLLTPWRSYYWPYNEDFVPKGADTSRFQSSGSISVRRRVLQEYAFSPLFGARVPCCSLGSKKRAREMMCCKAEIRECLCQLLQLPSSSVCLGPLVQTKEMLLYKSGTPLSPPLGDSRCTKANSYGRRPIAAHTVVDVFLPEEVEPGEVMALGHFTQEKLRVALAEFLRPRGNDSNSSSVMDAGDPARVLVSRLGITYCEVPPHDESGFVFDMVGGAEVTEDEVERIAQRWQARLA
ncbi:hypothetical protein ERJ75_001523800 [Trypanosoma vivax]|nr:hypothetical protein ERJ75_001523800 [Trypanosoma vivax]